MDIRGQVFRPLSTEEVSPLSGVLKNLPNILNQYLQTQLSRANIQEAQAKAKYAQPLAQAQLQLAQQYPDYYKALTGKTQLENQYYGPKTQADINETLARAGLTGKQEQELGFKLSHPGLFGDETTKSLELLKLMKILPENFNSPQVSPSPQMGQNLGDMQAQGPFQQNQQPSAASPFQTASPLANAILNKPFAKSTYESLMSSAFNWVHATPEQKTYMVAQLSGAGMDPSQAISQLASGKTVPQILSEKGFDPNNPPEPDFLPTKGNIQQLKQRQGALNEVNVLGEFVTKGLGPYSRTINSMSPLQITDALSGMNKDKQIQFLAARGLAPELVNLRLLLAGAKGTVSAQEGMMDKSMFNIKAFQSLVPPDVFTAAQKLMDKKLNEAFSKANEAYTVGKKSKSSIANSDLSSMSDDELRKIANG